MELPPLFDADRHLQFTIAEAKEEAEDESLHLTLLAADTEPVGLGFSLALLTGKRVVHPAALGSIGVPSEGLLAALRREWRVPARSKRSSPARLVPCWATAQSREAPSPSKGLMFTLKDLRWEAGEFQVTCSGKKASVEMSVMLNRDTARLHFNVPERSRIPLVRLLSGEVQALDLP